MVQKFFEIPASLNKKACLVCGKTLHSFDPMPRHNAKGGRPRDFDRPAEEAYGRLKWHEQYICYQYWKYKATRGREGWDPSESGSVNHQRTSQYLLALGSDSWFRHLANKMVTLAEKFENERKIPDEPNAEKIQPDQVTTRSKKTKSLPFSTLPAPSPFPIMPSFSSSLVAPSTPTTNEVTMGSNITPGVVTQAQQYPPLSALTCFGSYKKFNYTSRKKVERVCVRILTHSAVELQDIEYAWINPRTLKLVVYWPDWLCFAEQMAMFVVDSDGQPTYPPEQVILVIGNFPP
jgi:hypothetical protein